MSSSVEFSGYCAPGFEPVREALATNFREHGEVGADVAVVLHGETVVELWAGHKDSNCSKLWARDTVVNVWSATKGIGGTCFAMLVDRGLMSYEDRVSKHWPEFGAAGKADVTIGMLLAHQAGIPGFSDPATLADIFGGERSAARLAAQAPMTPLGSVSAYQAMTLGILATSLFKRIEGRSIRTFVADELKQNRKLDLSIGLNLADVSRVAETIPMAASEPTQFNRTNQVQNAAIFNPVTPAALANNPDWRAADLVSANGFTNGKALASMYNLLLRSGSNSKQLVSHEALAKATACRFAGIDLVKGEYTRWSAGYWLNPGRLYGPNLEAFGFSGFGGSFGFADPVADLSMGYSMNFMSDLMELNPRRRGLIDAAYACL